jgi:type I phosphodiesterase/nucleotide pyrophosphatase
VLHTSRDSFRRRGPFVLPDYERRGLNLVPATAQAVLGHGPPTPLLEALPLSSARCVIVILADGFGFDAWERHAPDHPVLHRMGERGSVSPITTVFPSTTAAAITTLHTGLTPAGHGVLEWWQWLDEVRQPVETLLWRGVQGDPLAVDARALWSGRTVYERFAEAGIQSFQVMPSLYAFSAYSRLTCRGGTTIGARSLPEQLARVRSLAESGGGPRYVYMHWGAIDKAGHAYGPGTSACAAAIAEFAAALEGGLARDASGAWADDTLVIVTADHGMCLMDLSKTVFVDRMPDIERRLAVPAWGSPRDLFLRAKPGEADAVREELGRVLAGKAMMVSSSEALRDGLFGPGEATSVLRARAGDLIALAYGDRGAWYELRPGLRWELPGMHGSLTPDEMFVPLAACRLSDLRP